MMAAFQPIVLRNIYFNKIWKLCTAVPKQYQSNTYVISTPINFVVIRGYAKQATSTKTSVTRSENTSTNQVPAAFSEKVKESTKTASYLGVILIGIGVTGALLYTVFRDLFSGSGPYKIYGKALDKCKADPRIIDVLGTPIAGYGEETRRGRRRHVSHLEYNRDGVNHMRMQFYVQGSRRKGTVQLEMKENERGKYEYRYMFVELEGYPSQTIILEDNR